MKKTFLAGVVALASITVVAAQQGSTAKPHSTAPAKKTATAAPTASTPAATSTSSTAPTPEVVEAFLKRLFGSNENLAFRVSSIAPTPAEGISEATAVVSTPQGQQVIRFFITGDGQHAIMGEMMPFGVDPFAADRATLKKSAFGPSKGDPNAPLMIVEFADLQCPACKAALPVIEKLQQDFPQARFIFQSYPLENVHPWAATAARYLDCMYRANNDAAWTFIDAVYSHQSEINETNLNDKLNTYVGLANQDPAKISACAASPEAQANVKKSEQIGNDVHVNQTPTVFVNGRALPGVNPQDYDALKSIVQFEANQAAQQK